MQLSQLNENLNLNANNSVVTKQIHSLCNTKHLLLPKINNETNVKKNLSDTICINVLSSLNKMISLPKLYVWNRLAKPVVVIQDCLRLQIRTNGLIIRRDKGWLNCHCIISENGSFIIYAKENECQGYAVSLKSAKRVEVLSEKNERTKNKNKLLNEKNYCTVTIKWKFGTVVINLTESQGETWRQIILNAFEGKTLKPFNQLLLLSNYKSNDNVTSLIKTDTEFVTNNLQKEVEVKNVSETEDEASAVESSQTERTNKTDITVKHISVQQDESQCEYDEFQDVKKYEKRKKPSNSLVSSDISNEEQNNTNMWSDDEIGNNVTPSNKTSFYASLPISFAHRYRSEGALMFNSNNARYSTRYDRKPLMEWLSTVGADNRFRRAKQYFESGAYKYEQKIDENEEEFNN